MRIFFIVEHPTQFEVPFYQFVNQQNGLHQFDVLFIGNKVADGWQDAEMGLGVKWGFPLYEGYRYTLLPNPSINAIENAIAEMKPDFILLNGYKGLYANAFAAVKNTGVPMGLRLDTVLTKMSIAEKWLRKLLLHKWYKHFSLFFCTGTLSQQYIIKMGAKKEQIAWFPYCVNDVWFNPQQHNSLALQLKHTWKLRQQIVLGVCKFAERENPIALLKAFIAINNPLLSLVLIGDGPQRNLLEQLAAEHPHLHIVFPGYMPYQQLPAWYALAKIFVHPAKDEPWGVSVQEAIIAGCTVIASSRVGSAVDLIEHGKNGFVYPWDNENALVNALSNALQLPDEAKLVTNHVVLQKWNYIAIWQQMQTDVIQLLSPQPFKNRLLNSF